MFKLEIMGRDAHFWIEKRYQPTPNAHRLGEPKPEVNVDECHVIYELKLNSPLDRDFDDALMKLVNNHLT